MANIVPVFKFANKIINSTTQLCPNRTIDTRGLHSLCSFCFFLFQCRLAKFLWCHEVTHRPRQTGLFNIYLWWYLQCRISSQCQPVVATGQNRLTEFLNWIKLDSLDTYHLYCHTKHNNLFVFGSRQTTINERLWCVANKSNRFYYLHCWLDHKKNFGIDCHGSLCAIIISLNAGSSSLIVSSKQSSVDT